MQRGKRHLETPNGLSYEELTEFKGEWIRPRRDAKQKILSGYLDLLYYEHNAQLAIRDGACGLVAVSLAVAFVLLHEHALVVATVVAILGVGTVIRKSRERERFSKFRDAVDRELRRLGVGIDGELLTDLGERTDLGTIGDYPVSGLGVVSPVHAEKLTVVGKPPVYALVNDEVYC